ncbi:MAG: Calx-beta domain-containing protein [Pleurocapsa sp. MO_192.B19]|nr:Calx-beta domain-containing protein [Pleurocapsa sp. MO_192.B19]
MIVFRNLNPIEVNESDSQIILEIDPSASGITEETAVQISTIDGSAISTSFNNDGVGVDFNAINNLSANLDPDNPDTLTFTVDIIDDAIAEPDEEFQFQINAVEDENLSGIATVIIQDNDSTDEPDLVVDGLLPGISISNVEQPEGDSSNTNFEFTVSLSEASEELITVDYSTADGIAESEDRLENGILVDLADYIPTTGTLEFNPGETEKTITVEVLTDTESIPEEAPEETFFVNLSNANNADIEQLVATGIILDDDLETETENNGLPFLQLESQTFVEGNPGDNGSQELTVNLVDADGASFIATQDITFSYRTADITAAANTDYEFIATQSGVITQGQSSTSIPVTIIGDDLIESDETFSVILADINSDVVQFSNAESELATEITIQDDDIVTDDAENPDPDDNIDINDIRGTTVFRFFDSAAGVHFYTASEAERDFVEDNLDNYELENPSYASINPENLDNAAEIYRFFNSTTGGHFYTANETERDFIIDNLDDFVFEDIAFSAFETNIDDTIPVYRFFETTTGVHFYTANEAERTFVAENLSNYNFEGIAYYALPLEADFS